MVSQVFGELKYDYLWEGKIRIFIYGKEVEVKLDIEDEDEQGISKIQEESFSRFRERKLEIDNKIQKLREQWFSEKQVIDSYATVKRNIEKQELANQSLNMQIDELASLENIQKVIKDEGLVYNNDSIKNID